MKVALLCVAVACFALSFMHLRADFPNGSPWNDWSKTTDEGWYAGGAVHRVLTGRWLEPGAFNPVVAMPVWPAMARAWFAVVGFGMVQLRVLTLLLSGASLLLFFRLVRQGAAMLPALLAVALLAADPFWYSFSRLAVLEPVMVFFLLLAMALSAEAAVRGGRPLHLALLCCGAGLACAALVLTKTTGLALMPGIFFLLWAGLRQRGAAAVPGVLMAAGSGLTAWALYYAVVIRRNAEDYRLLFRINQDRVHLSIVPLTAWHTLRDGMWIHPLLFPLAIVALLLAVVWMHELWQQPLFVSAVLLAAGYFSFIGYHSNLQPRYYLLVAPPVMMVLALALDRLAVHAREPWAVPATGAALKLYAGLLGVSLLWMAGRTAWYATHPEYSYLSAANGIARAVVADPTAHRLVIGNQGDTLSLWTGIPAICEEYSVDAPAEVLERYQPGWYVRILGGKTNAMQRAIEARYRVEQRAQFEVFDDPERHTLVLYRLLPR